MKVTIWQLAIINICLQLDNEWKAKTYGLWELITASEIFKEIKKCVKDDKFIDWEIKLTSEQKVFITKIIDARNWTINDAEIVFSLKELIK